MRRASHEGGQLEGLLDDRRGVLCVRGERSCRTPFWKVRVRFELPGRSVDVIPETGLERIVDDGCSWVNITVETIADSDTKFRSPECMKRRSDRIAVTWRLRLFTLAVTCRHIVLDPHHLKRSLPGRYCHNISIKIIFVPLLAHRSPESLAMASPSKFSCTSSK
jgi:hypothetical protein